MGSDHSTTRVTATSPREMVSAGHLAVQIAKELGAHATGTASAPKHDFLRELGTDSCIDYHCEDFTDTEEPFNVVLDTLGGKTVTRSVSVLRPGGLLVSLVPGREDTHAAARRAQARVVTLINEILAERPGVPEPQFTDRPGSVQSEADFGWWTGCWWCVWRPLKVSALDVGEPRLQLTHPGVLRDGGGNGRVDLGEGAVGAHDQIALDGQAGLVDWLRGRNGRLPWR